MNSNDKKQSKKRLISLTHAASPAFIKIKKKHIRRFDMATPPSVAAPPDLRVLCRRLTSTPVDDLPRLCPLLVGHVLRCGAQLSASPDAGKGKDKGSEIPVLVHKLRTHITSLLNGKNASGRFAAVCLVKAVVDVGGWESLRAAEPWVRGLIAIVQVCLFFGDQDGVFSEPNVLS